MFLGVVNDIIALKVQEKIGKPIHMGVPGRHNYENANTWPAATLLVITDDIRASVCKDIVAEITSKCEALEIQTGLKLI